MEYVTTRDFAFFVGQPNISLERTWSPDENFSYTFQSRGGHSAMVVALDDEIKLPGPFTAIDGELAFVPLCEAISIIAHEKPVVSVNNHSAGPNISISLNVILDPLSKTVSLGNGLPTVRWSFFNEFNGVRETITTNSTSISFRPRTNGVYQVRASVSDGALSKQVLVVTGMYTGGESGGGTHL